MALILIILDQEDTLGNHWNRKRKCTLSKQSIKMDSEIDSGVGLQLSKRVRARARID